MLKFNKKKFQPCSKELNCTHIIKITLALSFSDQNLWEMMYNSLFYKFLKKSKMAASAILDFGKLGQKFDVHQVLIFFKCLSDYESEERSEALKKG